MELKETKVVMFKAFHQATPNPRAGGESGAQTQEIDGVDSSKEAGGFTRPRSGAAAPYPPKKRQHRNLLRLSLGWILFAFVMILSISLPAAIESAPIASNASSGSSVMEAAAARYEGEGIGIESGADGTIQLICRMQRLTGEVLRTGLWLNSTETEIEDRFQFEAVQIGREDGPSIALDETGQTSWGTDVVQFVRPELVEEYSASVQGIRQDLIVSQAPQGVCESNSSRRALGSRRSRTG